MEVDPDSRYERYEEVASVMASWLHSSKDVEPSHLDLGTGEQLTHDQLATEIDQGTERGRAYVETFMDGAAHNEHLSLDEALSVFRRATKLNNSGRIAAFVLRVLRPDPVEKRIKRRY